LKIDKQLAALAHTRGCSLCHVRCRYNCTIIFYLSSCYCITHTVVDWVTISEEHSIYVADVGLGVAACDEIVAVTEQVCRGQYAAYTYAKQTLGCREFPMLAATCQAAAHTVTHAIVEFSDNADLALDDREPHMVKYDVTKKERQKLDMHTDKSEWTFLIALSNGYVCCDVCGLQIDIVAF
jgi:hypothetical protein